MQSYLGHQWRMKESNIRMKPEISRTSAKPLYAPAGRAPVLAREGSLPRPPVLFWRLQPQSARVTRWTWPRAPVAELRLLGPEGLECMSACWCVWPHPPSPRFAKEKQEPCPQDGMAWVHPVSSRWALHSHMSGTMHRALGNRAHFSMPVSDWFQRRIAPCSYCFPNA